MIEDVELAKLIPAPWNPRLIKTKEFGDLMKSMINDREFMQVKPLGITKNGTIYCGNQRYRAAEKLGWKTIPCVMQDISEDLAKERAIKDNNHFGEDTDELDKIVYDLKQKGKELETLGLKNLDKILKRLEPEIEEDVAPLVPAEAKTKLGDFYQLGDHRLLCGDSTKKEDVEKLMGGERADALITDPPYGINIIGANQTAGNFPGTSAPRHKAPPMVGDDRPFDPRHLLSFAQILILWGANHYADKLPIGSKWLVWDKKDGAFKNSDLGDCELAWTNIGGAARLLHHTWQGMYRKGAGERAERIHPTQKPVDLMAWCIKQAVVPESGIVIDCYAGSGSTLIACEQLKRKCYMMEISESYCDVIISRYVKFTKNHDIIKNGNEERWE